ncbi:putative TPR-repeat-containing chaperone protein DNAJ [Trypanosoma vivax]|nr:putative TPR-repeat-containing chaperone protein DNAJ [Trypanosoma vivax]
MSVRRLGGALRWVTIESLDERVQELEERLELCDVAALRCGNFVLPRAMECDEDLMMFEQAAALTHPRLGSKVSGTLSKHSLREKVHSRKPTDVGAVSERLMIMRQIQKLEKLGACIVSEIDRCRKTDEHQRLQLMEEELRVANMLKSGALRCLKATAVEEGKSGSDTNALSSESISSSSLPSHSSPNGVTSIPHHVATNNGRQPSGSYAFVLSPFHEKERPVVSGKGVFPSHVGRPSAEGSSGSSVSTSGKSVDFAMPRSSAPKSYFSRGLSTPSKAARSNGGCAATARMRHVIPNAAEMPAIFRNDLTAAKYQVNSRHEKTKLSVNSSSPDGSAHGDEPTNADAPPVSTPAFTTSTPNTVTHSSPHGAPLETLVNAKLGQQHAPVLEQHSGVCSLDTRPTPAEADRCPAGGSPFAVFSMATGGVEMECLPQSTLPLSELNELGDMSSQDLLHFSHSYCVRDPLDGRRGTPSQLQVHGKVPPFSQGNDRKGSVSQSELADSDVQFVRSRREQGNRFVKNKQYKEAIKAYTEAIEHDPDNDILFCNRAAAYLLSNQYSLALIDCENVIHRSPSNVKAHWRAAKALLYMNRISEAKHHYGKAHELSLGSADRRVIHDEMKALQNLQMYYSYAEEGRWSDCVACADQLFHVFGLTGAANLPWHVLKLGALLHLDPWRTLGDIKQLREAHDSYADLMFLHAKCLFYCAHNESCTEEALKLLRAAKKEKESEGGVEYDRYAMLEQTIISFERYRDQGNTAYEKGEWDEAYKAYTRCLTLDPLNKSLVAVTYCNRAATCMQEGRWKDALDDVNRSIRMSGNNAKAYARRGRINMYFYHEKEEQEQSFLSQAISDLRIAVELAPTDANKQHLAEALKVERERQNPSGGCYDAKGKNKPGSSERPRSRPRNPYCKSSASGGPRIPQRRGSRQWNNSPLPARSKAHCARILGLEGVLSLDPKSLVKAYHRAALQWHPDRWVNGNEEERRTAEQRFKEVNIAYNSLKELLSK